MSESGQQDARIERGAPVISVVIPAFNHGRFLDRTLNSVRAQSFKSWECIVVDDGSTDDTRAVAELHAGRDPRIRVVSVPNGGASSARNQGFQRADPGSQFVTFMDSDDVWDRHALEILISRLEADPEAIGAHGLAEMVDEEDNPVADWSHAAFGRNRLGLEGSRLVKWPLDRPTTFEVLINGNVLFPPGLVLARRTAYQRAGRFDERLKGGEDWDMLIRLSRFGYLSFVNEVLLHYRRHRFNLGAASGIAEQAWLVRCKGFHSPDNDARQHRVARLGWRAYQRWMIGQRLRATAEVRGITETKRAVNELARIPVHAFRWLRGYPTPRLRRASEPWIE